MLTHLLPLLLLACSDKAEPNDPPGPPDRDTGTSETATDSETTGSVDSEITYELDTALTFDTAAGPAPVESCHDLWKPTETAPTNLLVISIDTLRRDYLGTYSDRAHSPVLDGMLSEGLVLNDHRSCSDWTYASVLCALSGRYNEENDFFPRGGDAKKDDTQARVPDTPESITLMPDVFNALGYATGIVTANAFMGPGFGIGGRYDRTNLETGSANQVTQVALEVAGELNDLDKPWLLHVHYIDPHSSYNPPDSYVADALAKLEPIDYTVRSDEGLSELSRDWDKLPAEEQALILQHIDALYSAEITYMDDQIQRLMNGLRSNGMLSDTLVMFWSDHGEQFFEHGSLKHHKHLYSEETAALAGFWVQDAPLPVTWDGPTTHSDLLPTALCLMDLPEHAAATGVPAGTAHRNRARFSSVLLDGNSQASVDVAGMRLHYFWSGRKQLFDLSEDPGEQNNLASSRPKQVRALWDLVEPMVIKADELHHDAEATLD